MSNREPIMSIGLVLPEDKQGNISMALNGAGFELHINNVDQKNFEKKLDIKYLCNHKNHTAEKKKKEQPKFTEILQKGI